jgi:hypothetical protein
MPRSTCISVDMNTSSSDQVSDMSSSGNPMVWIMLVESFTGANFLQWREKINMSLAIFR